ncbi:SIS domain-containing protein [Curtobacterium sp. VKM Ac-1376]|uniref:SIS domain-containing protein n=1 Tax=Curtobacterium sp. VKM Ac-1376 TaxID=123312 RepID=UPI00188ABC5F|nr:SIS domain-containing protein [Curtobacterium sp. VKM Ac-1376]MBF4616023.1 SIS domain-containing protein [Curtobacterium sp. VKM Ac-1376]
MIKFDADAYRAVLTGAVAQRDRIEQITAEIADAGFDNLFLIGSGGSYGAMLPMERLVQNHSTLPVRAAIAGELVLTDPPMLGARSVAVFSSLSGTTGETIAAVEYCKARGVTTIGLTGDADSTLAELADHVVVNPADNATAAESITTQLLLLTTSLLSRRGEFADYERLADATRALPEGLPAVAIAADPFASDWAERHAATDYHFLVGAGELWGFTYNYSMCVLEEMQWLRTTRVSGAEFFHGSLELIERDTSLVLFFGEDESRPLMERVRKFSDRYSDDVTVIDTHDYAVDGIDEDLRGYFSTIILGTVTYRVSVQLERVRDHDLDLRRYYRTVEY